MKIIVVACAAAAVSLFASATAEAACRQVYGGTSCNVFGHCWHNPPKTVCDAPPARINTTIAPRPTLPVAVNPNAGNRFISDQGGGLLANSRAGIVSDGGLGARPR
jgi:hypothetical protein